MRFERAYLKNSNQQLPYIEGVVQSLTQKDKDITLTLENDNERIKGIEFLIPNASREYSINLGDTLILYNFIPSSDPIIISAIQLVKDDKIVSQSVHSEKVEFREVKKEDELFEYKVRK